MPTWCVALVAVFSTVLPVVVCVRDVVRAGRPRGLGLRLSGGVGLLGADAEGAVTIEGGTTTMAAPLDAAAIPFSDPLFPFTTVDDVVIASSGDTRRAAIEPPFRILRRLWCCSSAAAATASPSLLLAASTGESIRVTWALPLATAWIAAGGVAAAPSLLLATDCGCGLTETEVAPEEGARPSVRAMRPANESKTSLCFRESPLLGAADLAFDGLSPTRSAATAADEEPSPPSLSAGGGEVGAAGEGSGGSGVPLAQWRGLPSASTGGALLSPSSFTGDTAASVDVPK